ncbi:MAG: hypothetical protein CMA72_07210 [Euryarchaeota archaeon]|nr:hypothetical protein [Euryarchaeota archaeon]
MKRKKTKPLPGANIMTEKHPDSPYKKNDLLWFQDYSGQWRWGSLAYFSKAPAGKEWVTLCDFSEGGAFYSTDIDGLQEQAPDAKIERKVKNQVKRNKSGGKQ